MVGPGTDPGVASNAPSRDAGPKPNAINDNRGVPVIGEWKSARRERHAHLVLGAGVAACGLGGEWAWQTVKPHAMRCPMCSVAEVSFVADRIEASAS